LTKDPPPDLTWEIDITNRSHPETYQSLGVLELRQYKRGELQFLLLQNGRYIESETSLIFPLLESIPQYLTQCCTEVKNKGMRAFRNWIKEQA